MPVTPFVPFSTGMQVNIRWTLQGEPIEMVLGFDYGTVGFADAAPLVWGRLDSLWDDIRGIASPAMVSTDTYMVDLTNQFAGSASFGPFSSPAGSTSGLVKPNNVAFVITHRTAARGKSFRGRSYIAGWTDSTVTGNYLGVAYADGLAASFNSMRTDLALDDIKFCVLSRRINGAWRENGVATPVTLSLYRDLALDSQRGRLPGH